LNICSQGVNSLPIITIDPEFKALKESYSGETMMHEYISLLSKKQKLHTESGFEAGELPAGLFDYQADIVRWATKKGKACIFAGTGLGKTAMQLSWAEQVENATGGNVLIVCPLAVAAQTVQEGKMFGINVTHCRTMDDVKPGINIVNYERLHLFKPEVFAGVVLDESSILKNYNGTIRNQICEMFRDTPYRLCCSATPSPNDHTELGNHAEFLGIMTMQEMLATFFMHDGGDTSVWRLKRHAVKEFWQWVASWAVMLQNPRDLGYDGSRFDLPALNIEQITVEPKETAFFYSKAKSLSERRTARKESIAERVAAAAELVNKSKEPWIVWCDLNDESKALTAAIPDAVEIKGTHKPEYKENEMNKFSSGDTRVLVTKPQIAGWGLNWQHCHNMAFVGLSDSFEMVYQAIRRCWRFGQTKPVNVYFITSKYEGEVVRNIKHKEKLFQEMLSGMIAATQELCSDNIRGTTNNQDYNPAASMKLPAFISRTIQNGCPGMEGTPAFSTHHTKSITS